MFSYANFIVCLTQEETIKLQRQNDMLETRLQNSSPTQARTTPGRGRSKELENKVWRPLSDPVVLTQAYAVEFVHQSLHPIDFSRGLSMAHSSITNRVTKKQKAWFWRNQDNHRQKSDK